MATRWEVEEAVFASSIEPTGRHILLTLLSRTNASTAEIPSRHSPTFTELERLTGYSRSTLIEWMKALGETHWLTRPVLVGESKPGMRLAVGDPAAARPKRSRTSKAADAAYRQAVQTPDASVPPGDTDRTAQRYDGVPPGGTPQGPLLLKDFPTESPNPTTNLDRSAGADDAVGGFAGVDFGPRVAVKPKRKTRNPKPAPKEETEGQRLNRIAKVYTDVVKLSNIFAIKEIVRVALGANFSEEQIINGLRQLADKEDPCSKETLRRAIKGPPSWVNVNNQGRPAGLGSTRHRVQNSHDDPDRYDEGIS